MYFFLVYQERGIHVHSNFDLDEETKYSSVMRGVDDSGCEENEDIWDSENNETFWNVSDNTINKSSTDSENRFLLICWIDIVLCTIFLQNDFIL